MRNIAGEAYGRRIAVRRRIGVTATRAREILGSIVETYTVGFGVLGEVRTIN